MLPPDWLSWPSWGTEEPVSFACHLYKWCAIQTTYYETVQLRGAFSYSLNYTASWTYIFKSIKSGGQKTGDFWMCIQQRWADTSLPYLLVRMTWAHLGINFGQIIISPRMISKQLMRKNWWNHFKLVKISTCSTKECNVHVWLRCTPLYFDTRSLLLHRSRSE